MPCENIGECGDAQLPDEHDRMVAEVVLGARYVELVCGEPPEGCEVGMMWHEHELGAYATVGFYWDLSVIDDAPWEYIARAERALSRFDEAVDWQPIQSDGMRRTKTTKTTK